MVEALVQAGLAKSNKEARGFVQSNAVLINGSPAEANNPNHAAEKPDDLYLLTDAHKRFGQYTIIKRGKRNQPCWCGRNPSLVFRRRFDVWAA